MSEIFKKTIIVSLLGHITVFSIFSFTFGTRILKADYANVSFLGAVLRNADLSSRSFSSPAGLTFNVKPKTLALDRENKGYTLVLHQYFKPSISLPVNEEKIIFMPKRKSISFFQKKKEPIIMLYPQLPYHFLIYFKNRQRVHIELMYNIISSAMTNTILIKRKISSGNLEADLLSMRYISHYLFIQQARFTPNKWQTVKIDLSAKDKE